MMAAFTDEVKRSGYVAPDSLVERSMLRYFQNENNEYSPRIYRDTPDSRKIEIQNETEKQLIFNLFHGDKDIVDNEGDKKLIKWAYELLLNIAKEYYNI